MEKVGIQLVAEGAAEVLRQINSAKQAITEFASAGVAAASNLRIVDTAATGVGQALNALKARQVEVTQSANQLKTAQIENVQSTNQLKSAQSSEAQELNKLKSSQTELVQSATQLKTAQTEGLQSTNQLKTAQTEEVQELGKLKTAQTEGVQQLGKLKTAQTESVQASGQLKTAQTQETQELNKLKTAQTEETQGLTKLKTAQIENVQATTQLKTAQAGAVTELGKLRVAQTENVQASTQVKIAEVEETQALTKLKTAQAEAATSLANLRKEQTADAAAITQLKAHNLELDASLKQTKISTMQQASAHEAAAKSGSNFGSVTSLLNAKNSALAIGTVAAAKSTLELAAGFDDAMATVQVATGISDRQSESYKRLEAAAREVGGSTKFSATEAAQGLAALSQAGLDADQAITALPAVAQAAQVNNVSLAESAQTVTIAMNAFGLSASDATKIIDLQTTAAAAGILDFNDFKAAIASVGSVAKLSNQSLSETTSVLLALTNNGQSATDAGTSLKSALLALTKPTSSAQAAIDTLGLSIYDSSGKMRPFSDIIAQVEKNTKGMTDEQKNNLFATIAGSDGIRAFSGALNAHTDVMRNGVKVTLIGSEALKEWDKQLDNSAGSTQKAADILGNTFNAQVEKMVGNIQDAAIGIGQKLLPQLTGIVKGVSSVIDKIQGFEESTHILTTLTSIGFKPLEGAIIAVNFVFDKAGELVTFLQPWLALLGSTIETKIIPPLKTMGEIAATPFELLDAGLKKIDFGFASGNIDQLKSKIVELKGKTDDTTKANQVFAASISGNRVQSQLAVADLGNMAKTTAQLANTTVNTTKAVTDLTAGIVNVTATPIANGIVAMTKFGDVSGSTTGQLKNVNAELTRLNTLISQSSQEMNDASGKMGTLDKIAQNMSPDVANLWNEWKNYNDKVAEGGVNSDMWSTKAEQVKSKLIALNPKLADVTAAYEIQSEKLKTSTKSFEDNTISMSLNEGKATNLSATLKGETTSALNAVGKAALDQIPNFESMNRQIQTTPGVTTTAMANTRNAITAQNFASAAFNVGASVALGIKNGINSEVASVASAAANLVNQAMSSARAAGRISSPSKESEEKIGKPIAEGVALGILQNAKQVMDAMGNLMGGVTTAALDASIKQAETLTKVSDATKAIFENLDKLRDYVQIGEGPIRKFSQDTFSLAAEFYNASKNFTTKMLEATDKFSDSVAKVGTGAAAAFGALDKLKDYAFIGKDKIYAFGQDVFSLSAEFYNNSTKFNTDMLISTDQYSDTVGKVSAGAGAAFTALSNLPKYSQVGLDAIHNFGSDVLGLTAEFSNNAIGFSDKMLESTTKYSDTVSKVSAAAAVAFPALSNLKKYSQVGLATIHDFSADILGLVAEFSNNSIGFDQKMLVAASTYADAATKAVAVVGAGVTNFEKLRKYKTVARENIDNFVNDLNALIAQTITAAQQFDAKSVTATAVWSESIGKLTSGLKGGMDLFEKLRDYKQVASTAIRAFVADIDLTVQLAMELVKRTDSDLMVQVGAFGDAVNKLFGGFNSAMSTFQGLEKYKAIPSNVIKNFISEIEFTVGLAEQMVKTTDTDLLDQTVSFFIAVGQVFTNIKTAMDTLTAMEAYKVVPPNMVKAIIKGMDDANKLFYIALQRADTFGVDATEFGHKIDAAAKEIDRAVALAASEAAKAAAVQVPSAPNVPSAPAASHAKGGIHTGGAAVLAEAGAELMQLPNNTVKLVVRPTFFPDLPRGTKIFNAQETRGMIQYPMSAGQMMMQTYNQQSYQNNYNLSLSGMGMSSGNVMSDFAIMQLMGA